MPRTLEATPGTPRRRGIEERIEVVARRQQGVITRPQLLEAGLSPAAIGRSLRARRLRALHRGVYVLGPVVPEAARDMAAVLAGGVGALLSHTTAAAALGLRPIDPDGPRHVTGTACARPSAEGVCFHRVRRIDDDERSVIRGIPVTCAGRTLVDLAGMLGRREVELAVATARRQGLIRPEELSALLLRYRRRRGTALLRAVVEEEGGPPFTRSVAERRCLDLFESAGLPRPLANARVGPYELDFLWPDVGVAVEVDGRAYHSADPRFEGDRRKDAWLRARSIQVVRLTWRQITRDALPTAVQVGQILALAARDRRERGRG